MRDDVDWLRARPPLVGEEAVVTGTDLRLRAGTIAPLANDAWRRAWRHATATVAQTYGDPQGPRAVREAIAEHVRDTRGVACVADDVVVTSGASDALALLLRATMSAGDVLAAENPGYRGVTRLAAVHGIRLLPLAVDEHGADVEALLAASPLVVHVTPSHQFPTGAELSPDRRAALLAWAQERGALVIENDYDGEFRFDGAVAAPLTAIDTSGTVCLVGTFSRLLTPALRVGYIVATPALAQRVAALKRALDEHPSLPAQHAVAQLIRSGELGRHLRRVRALATHKRGLLRAALGSLAGRQPARRRRRAARARPLARRGGGGRRAIARPRRARRRPGGALLGAGRRRRAAARLRARAADGVRARAGGDRRRARAGLAGRAAPTRGAARGRRAAPSQPRLALTASACSRSRPARSGVSGFRMREIGPETLIAATGRPAWSSTGVATHATPSSCSSLSVE